MRVWEVVGWRAGGGEQGLQPGGMGGGWEAALVGRKGWPWEEEPVRGELRGWRRN